MFPQSFRRIFKEGNFFFWQNTLQGFPGVRETDNARKSLLPVPNYNTPVKDLTYKDLLTNTFTVVSYDRGIKTWCVRLLVLSVYCDKYRYIRFNVECHMDHNIGKVTNKERTFTPYEETLLTSWGPRKRKRFFGSSVSISLEQVPMEITHVSTNCSRHVYVPITCM